MDIRHDESVQIRNETPRGPWPEDSLARVPYWVYQDEPNYKREMRQIFEAATWNFVCLEADIPNKGDYRTNQVGDMPVIVVRDADGSTFRPTEPGNGSCAGFVVFVHGLCNSELDWQTPAHRRLVTELRDAGRMVAWLRYNSGRAIHENGCELADLLFLRRGQASRDAVDIQHRDGFKIGIDLRGTEALPHGVEHESEDHTVCRSENAKLPARDVIDHFAVLDWPHAVEHKDQQQRHGNGNADEQTALEVTEYSMSPLEFFVSQSSPSAFLPIKFLQFRMDFAWKAYFVGEGAG